ncbi:hypothetical protein CAQU_10645 [Corynebacterium aquilae DSM 44791]|uniref:Translation elongation factor n=1 Tax=Corynebacterium aquilae DSM 44791 TaxID=1431546 RepID=A0A1L7CHY2_9CORY|nr:hypothetical protein CAQU_10645 [Corynebacterium aquilae DSM 44791]
MLESEADELKGLLREKPKSGKLGAYDLGWLKLFRDNNYLDVIEREGFFRISPTEIKDGSGMEPRLMCKHDFRSAQPEIFRQENLSILPLTRTEYVVGRFDTFHEFPDVSDLEITYIDIPEDIESLDFNDLTSEAVALNAASIAGIFEDFLGEERAVQTLSGRMSTRPMKVDLAIPSGRIDFEVNTQMELDAGFETENSLVLVEAKNKLPDDFNIRQVYYPYLRFAQQVSKPVRNLYVTYSNGVFTVYEFTFRDLHDLQSIENGKVKRYKLRSRRLTLEVIRELAKAAPARPSIVAPFPQADRFDRVINICETLVDRGQMPVSEIPEDHGFVQRQANYYVSAGTYVGLLENTAGEVELSEAGRKVMEEGDMASRQKGLISMILADSTFRKAFLKHENPQELTLPEVREILAEEHPELSESTCGRRAQTVMAWIRWILAQVES